MFKTVLIIVFLVNKSIGDYYCPFPEDVPDCECRTDIGLLTCHNKAKAIPLPKLNESQTLKFNEVILENIGSSNPGNKFFSKINADKITIKKMDNNLLKGIQLTNATQLILEDITNINMTDFLSKDFHSLTHLTIKNGTTQDTEIKGKLNVFDKLRNLKFIDLKQHKIEAFEVNSFKKLDSLEKIDLSFNSITLNSTANKYEFSSTDLTIDLSNNGIDDSKISDQLEFKTKPNGFILVDLSANSITVLKETVFKSYCNITGGISISVNLKNNNMSCLNKYIKWLFDCERSLEIFQNLYCSEYDRLFAEMSLDDFIDRDKPKGKLEIRIISVNLTVANLVNVAVCIQDPSDDKIQCELCVKPGKDETKDNATKTHILDTPCKMVKDKLYREDSVITIGIADERHSNLNVTNVEGFASIALYEDIMKSQMNDTEYIIKSTDESPTWTAVVKIKWTEIPKTI